ncbi:conserved hypothetical protein [Mesorhizobium plurifarium]|uniref:Uncharacterized protein n=1 Tax=Mesorhizobium plurifarium TaxID=69974 RepID=A0A090E275_MESPL|nr:conserved hypothetical protein [Mesorhizobium plurifarium]
MIESDVVGSYICIYPSANCLKIRPDKHIVAVVMAQTIPPPVIVGSVDNLLRIIERCRISFATSLGWDPNWLHLKYVYMTEQDARRTVETQRFAGSYGISLTSPALCTGPAGRNWFIAVPRDFPVMVDGLVVVVAWGRSARS